MTTAVHTKPAYQPQITEVLPTTKEQRRMAAEGFRGFWVEAKSQQMRKGVRIIRYLLTVMPSGYIKCPCEHSKFSHSDCCHKTALRAHLAFLTRRERAIIVNHTPESFSIFADTPRERRYQTLEDQAALRDGAPSGEYASHAYR